MAKKSKKQALSSKQLSQLSEIVGGGIVMAVTMALLKRRGATIIRKHGRHCIYSW